MSVIEMEMLRRMCGCTREDGIKNDFIKGSIGMVPIVDKLRENKLRWLVYTIRRDEV